MSDRTARLGDVVVIKFKGQLTDGTPFDSADDDTPFEFELGSEEVVTGITRAVLGMKAGEVKKVTIPPDEGYGDRDEDLVQTVPREDLPDEVEEGDELSATEEVEGEEDEDVIVWVREVRETEAVVDANHPLAGATLELEIELLEIKTE